jgi:hypothetical protein
VDVALIREVTHLIELKVAKTKFGGVAQLGTYMRTLERPEGWLVVFDASPPTKVLEMPRVVDTSSGRIRVVRIDINPPMPSRRKISV